MPYLKEKIIKALQSRLPAKSLGNKTPKFFATSQKTLTINNYSASSRPRRTKPSYSLAEPKQLSVVERDQSLPSSKNIVKNFGKAMCSFASSKLALPYLETIQEKASFNIDVFQEHMQRQIRTIDSLYSVRSLLYVQENEDETSAVFKRVFQEVSVVFIKYFSVNWIFQGKMSHKEAHLKARFKMLRRVQNPEFFTYFKNFSKR